MASGVNSCSTTASRGAAAVTAAKMARQRGVISIAWRKNKQQHMAANMAN